jgi:predicted 3-demethylubiquinone-9 3-methyltransferase (glyoxalase superfamily)
LNKITPFLWFDDQAEQAMKFYLSVFKRSRKIDVMRKGKQVMATTFELNGQDFVALNGGPHFKFTPAVSFFVRCKDQAEIDYYWEALSAGGAAGQCGWLTDKYGLSWQIVPSALEDLLWNKDAKKKDQVWEALMKMTKISIQGLKDAAAPVGPSGRRKKPQRIR